MSEIPVAQVHCLVLDGVDARRFAQAQFSGNVEHLVPGHWQWNAWLDAQGRVRCLLQLVDAGDGNLLAIARGGDVAQIHADLSRYLLRMHAALSQRTFAGVARGPLPMGDLQVAAGDLVLGYGDRSLCLRPVGDGVVDQTAAERWRRAEIRAGWPRLPRGDTCWLPPALGLERLGAVALDKGCYPGQEIVARLHYRGGHKLRLHHVRGPAALPLGACHDDAGTPVFTLDTCAADGGFESLVITASNLSLRINMLHNTYEVISMFDA